MSSEKLIGYGSILFDHETLSASDKKKRDFMSAVMMGHKDTPTSVRVVKQVPKINSVVSGDEVEVVGVEVEEVKTVSKVYTYTPIPELIAFEPELMALNIFGYGNKPKGKPVVLSDDEQFKNELLTIPGFTF